MPTREMHSHGTYTHSRSQTHMHAPAQAANFPSADLCAPAAASPRNSASLHTPFPPQVKSEPGSSHSMHNQSSNNMDELLSPRTSYKVGPACAHLCVCCLDVFVRVCFCMCGGGGGCVRVCVRVRVWACVYVRAHRTLHPQSHAFPTRLWCAAGKNSGVDLIDQGVWLLPCLAPPPS